MSQDITEGRTQILWVRPSGIFWFGWIS
jgi:hypothetical protein